MGYDLHITRRQSWTDQDNDISFDEFVDYVSSDPEFTYPSAMGKEFADWKSPRSGYGSWLCWSDGESYTKNPEPEFIDKLVVIARALNAKAQGDDHEVYRSATEYYHETAPDAAEPAVIRASRPLSFRLQLILAFLLGCVLLGLKLLFFGE